MKKIIPVSLLLLSGCTTCTTPPVPCPTVLPTVVQTKEQVHTARYTLVDIAPSQALRFPLQQIVTRTLAAPKKHHRRLTRQEALQDWLNGSGYELCLPVTSTMKLFYSSPLPDAQRRMGPVRIEQALQTIAGSAWTMTTDEVLRTVCWQPASIV